MAQQPWLQVTGFQFRLKYVFRVDVLGLDDGVIALDPGFGHTCAITSLGGARCWGDNLHGQFQSGEQSYKISFNNSEPQRALRYQCQQDVHEISWPKAYSRSPG